MNKERRNRIDAVISSLEELRDELMLIQEEEETAYDNLPESLQDSERGEQMYENADNLQDACDNLDDVISDLTDILNDN